MIENRDLTMDDYLAMVKRRLNIILIPALLAPIAGFLVSYAFPPKYTSQATVLVEVQKVPGTYVQPVITADLMQRVATMKQRILAPASLRTMIDGLNVAKPGEESAIIQEIQSTMTVTALSADLSAPSSSSSSSSAGSTKKSNAPKQAPNTTSIPGFLIGYSSSDPRRAQEICNALVGLLVQENLRTRSATAKGTTDFLSRQVDEAKQALDQMDKDLAEFKSKNAGLLPSDADNNMRVLASMNSQLDASTQTLNRAQQDKAYTESLLAQQLAAWKSSQSSNNPQTMEQQLNILQTQLMQLQARYTNDHPDVIKTKADIAEVKKRLAEVNNPASGATDTTQKATASEPPEIRQLRLQLHQYDNVITQATQDQKRLQSSIQVAQGRTMMSPAIEEDYKKKTRDYDNALTVYQGLLAKKSSSELGEDMENQAQGEQLSLLAPAGLPKDPTFPNRLYFAGGGMAAGLVLGIAIAIWLEIRDRSIRTERDAAAAMDLPLLVSVPWVSDEEEVNANGNGRRPFWGRANDGAPDRERIGV